MPRNANFNRFLENFEMAMTMVELTRHNHRFDHVDNSVEIVRTIESPEDHFREQCKQAWKTLNKAKKCPVQSDLYRNKGNEQYAKGNCAEALELFNQSICFAPKESQQLGKGYANRSAVYFSLKMYDLCLENIKMAREAGYPVDLIAKLDERQVKCEEMSKKSELKSENKFNGLKPELTYPPHEKVPFIANCLDLNVNEKYGRHIVTKCDLNVGDVVAIERPFCGVNASDIRYICCANCFDENNLNLIPCSDCHSAMFCNEKCYAEAMANYHDIECPLMSLLFDAKLLGMSAQLIKGREFVALRLFIQLVKSFKTLNELMEFVRNVKNGEHNAFTINYENNDKLEFLAAILKLKCHEKKITTIERSSLGLVTGLFHKFLLKATDFKKIFKTREEEDFLIELIFHLCHAMQMNSFPISQLKKIEPETKKLENGLCFGVYLFSSLLNHSCAPNAHQAKHGVNNIIIVTKPIKAGEQLFVSYLYLHSDTDRAFRQKMVSDSYWFNCNCLACVRNYPKLKLEEMIESNDIIKPRPHMRLIGEYKLDAIKQLIPKYQDYLNANSTEYYPNNHTCVAERILLAFWNFMYSADMPLAAKKKLGFFN